MFLPSFFFLFWFPDHLRQIVLTQREPVILTGLDVLLEKEKEKEKENEKENKKKKKKKMMMIWNLDYLKQQAGEKLIEVLNVFP